MSSLSAPGHRFLFVLWAVERVISGPQFAAAALRIGASMRADAAAQGGIAELEALAAVKRVGHHVA